MLRNNLFAFMQIASKVVELAYNDWANASQRALLSQEFYGPEFKLFKDEGITTLAAALKKYPAKKDSFLKHMSQSIAPIIAKGVFNHSLLHRLTHEYLSNCSVKERSEMIANLREAVAQVLHTRDGARVGMLCIWHGNNKDRKVTTSLLLLKTSSSKFLKNVFEHLRPSSRASRV